MKAGNSTRTRVAAALGVAGLACSSAIAGGISLYEVGSQKQESSDFSWGWSVSYVAQGTLRSNASGNVPVVLGGRGDVVGSFDDARIIFLALNFNWKR